MKTEIQSQPQNKVLITGITGFAGSHLAEYIQKIGNWQVYGIRRYRSKMDNVDHLKDIIYYDCDIKDSINVLNVINNIRPDKIFHLAAQSYVPTSWESPGETLDINIRGTCNLFEAIRKCKNSDGSQYEPIIQIACSSEEYGKVAPEEVPITEKQPLKPMSPYGVSKVCQDLLAQQYHQSYGIKVVITRAFNHSGPCRGEFFVDSNFAKQIALIEKYGFTSTIEVGNLEAIRDFTDVRDIVRAYWLATEKCDFGVPYNICSEKGYSIDRILKKLLSYSEKQIYVKQDKDRMRPSDVPILHGDSGKFRSKTGWSPKIDYFEKTLFDTLEYWRKLV